MIKKIIIENFQSHKKTEMKFTEHLNVIFGESDSGKSAIRRAIQSVINKNTFHIRYGEKVGSVEIHFDDCVVIREYTKTKLNKCPSCKAKIGNEQICETCSTLIPDKHSSDKYIIDGEIIDKFGANLPEHITEKIKMCGVLFGDMNVNLNVSTQFEDMFFIGNTYNGAARNKLITGIVPDSHRIAEVIYEINEERNDKRSELKVWEKEQKEKENVIELVREDIAEIKELNQKYDEIDKSICVDEEYLSKLNDILISLDKYGNLDNLVNKMDKIGNAVSKAKMFLSKIHDIDNQFKNTSGIYNAINCLKLHNIELPEFGKPYENINEIEKNTYEIANLEKILDISKFKLHELDLKGIGIENLSILEEYIEDMKSYSQLMKMYKEYLGNHKLLENNNENLKDVSNRINMVINEFKKSNPDLICPEIDDVYCDSCLKILAKNT